MDSYKKYLKYKNKYLQLKKNLVGGSRCPEVGNSQHKGECFHDSISTILLYSDGISEHLQQLFNRIGNEDGLDKCITEANKLDYTFDYLLPLNIAKYSDKQIDKDNFRDFIQISKLYIKNLYKRYRNDLAKGLPEPQAGLFASRSAESAFECAIDAVKISNINSLSPKQSDLEKHSGSIIDDLIVPSIINYYLINYERTITPKYIYTNVFYIRKVFKCPIRFILAELLKVKETLNTCKGILISLGNIKDNTSITGHDQALIQCNTHKFFYDNNKVNSTDFFEKFDWKEYLGKKLDMLIKLFTIFNNLKDGEAKLQEKLQKFGQSSGRTNYNINSIFDLKIILSGFFSWMPDIEITNLNDPNIIKRDLNINYSKGPQIGRGGYGREELDYYMYNLTFINISDAINKYDYFYKISNTFKYYEYSANATGLTNAITNAFNSINMNDLYYIFYNAILSNNEDLIKLILESDKAILIREEETGNNLLHCAVSITEFDDNADRFKLTKDIVSAIVDKQPALLDITNYEKENPLQYILTLKSKGCKFHLYEHLYSFLNKIIAEKTIYNESLEPKIAKIKRSDNYKYDENFCKIDETPTPTVSPLREGSAQPMSDINLIE
jgi:hypothetical protein